MILTDQERAAVQLELAGGRVGLAERLVLLGVHLGLERAAKMFDDTDFTWAAEAIREAAKE